MRLGVPLDTYRVQPDNKHLATRGNTACLAVSGSVARENVSPPKRFLKENHQIRFTKSLKSPGESLHFNPIPVEKRSKKVIFT